MEIELEDDYHRDEVLKDNNSHARTGVYCRCSGPAIARSLRDRSRRIWIENSRKARRGGKTRKARAICDDDDQRRGRKTRKARAKPLIGAGLGYSSTALKDQDHWTKTYRLNPFSGLRAVWNWMTLTYAKRHGVSDIFRNLWLGGKIIIVNNFI